MRLTGWMCAALAAMLATGSAQAADDKPCGKGLVCASAPQTIATALSAAGYKAELTTDKAGDPMIRSAAAGYNFIVYFYGCKDHKQCSSLQFMSSFEADGTNTPELANKWNNSKRFSQMAVTDDGALDFSYDVATIGGLNQENFTDVIEWWEAMLGQVSQFFKEQSPKK